MLRANKTKSITIEKWYEKDENPDKTFSEWNVFRFIDNNDKVLNNVASIKLKSDLTPDDLRDKFIDFNFDNRKVSEKDRISITIPIKYIEIKYRY